MGTDAGGMVLLGPSGTVLVGVEALAARPDVVLIEADADALSDWDGAPAESLRLAREASQAGRAGLLAVVALDVHLQQGAMPPQSTHGFICSRMSRAAMGLADRPSYLVLFGRTLAQSVVVDGLGERSVQVVEQRPDDIEVWELSPDSMFPGLPVAALPGSADITAVFSTIDRLESQYKK